MAANRRPWSAVVAAPIEPARILARVGDDVDGAQLLFVGVVRNHADGRGVSGMTYEAYAPMAEEVLRQIVAEAVEIAGTDRVAAVHRVGELAIGEASVAIAVSSPHRDEAYRASRHVIEEIKKRLPVWKREHYADGESDWVPGVVPPGGGDGTSAGRGGHVGRGPA